MFCFPETEFFLINCFDKKNIHYFIEQNRQLVNPFFLSNYLPKTIKNLNEQKDILWRRILFTFFSLPINFFSGWSSF